MASLLGWHLGVSINTTRCFQTVSDIDIYEAKGFSYSPFRFPPVQSTLQLRLLTLRQAHEQIRASNSWWHGHVSRREYELLISFSNNELCGARRLFFFSGQESPPTLEPWDYSTVGPNFGTWWTRWMRRRMLKAVKQRNRHMQLIVLPPGWYPMSYRDVGCGAGFCPPFLYTRFGSMSWWNMMLGPMLLATFMSCLSPWSLEALLLVQRPWVVVPWHFLSWFFTSSSFQRKDVIFHSWSNLLEWPQPAS